MLAEKTHHAPRMPRHVTQTSVTRTSRDMRDALCRAHHHHLVAIPEPRTQVYVFVIQEETLIKTAHCGEISTPKQHEHAGNPWDRKRPIIYVIFQPSVVPAKRLLEKAEHGWKMTCAVLASTERSHHSKRTQGDCRFLKAGEQAQERIDAEPDVRIEDGEEWRLRDLKSGVVIRRKTSRVRVLQYVHSTGKPRSQFRLWHIQREKHAVDLGTEGKIRQ